MGALADLWRSERGFLFLAIIIASSVLAGIGVLPIADWKDIVIGTFGLYVFGKSATGVAAIIKRPSEPNEDVIALIKRLAENYLRIAENYRKDPPAPAAAPAPDGGAS